MPSVRPAWGTQERHRIAGMIAAGLSMTGIGRKEGLSRNQVAGRIHRDKDLRKLMALRHHSPASRKPAIPKARPAEPKAAPAPASAPVAKAARMRMVPLIRLRIHDCRYPVDESPRAIGRHRFCGRRCRPGESYCEEHKLICTPPRERS